MKLNLLILSIVLTICMANLVAACTQYDAMTCNSRAGCNFSGGRCLPTNNANNQNGINYPASRPSRGGNTDVFVIKSLMRNF